MRYKANDMESFKSNGDNSKYKDQILLRLKRGHNTTLSSLLRYNLTPLLTKEQMINQVKVDVDKNELYKLFVDKYYEARELSIKSIRTEPVKATDLSINNQASSSNSSSSIKNLTKEELFNKADLHTYTKIANPLLPIPESKSHSKKRTSLNLLKKIYVDLNNTDDILSKINDMNDFKKRIKKFVEDADILNTSKYDYVLLIKLTLVQLWIKQSINKDVIDFLTDRIDYYNDRVERDKQKRAETTELTIKWEQIKDIYDKVNSKQLKYDLDELVVYLYYNNPNRDDYSNVKLLKEEGATPPKIAYEEQDKHPFNYYNYMDGNFYMLTNKNLKRTKKGMIVSKLETDLQIYILNYLTKNNMLDNTYLISKENKDTEIYDRFYNVINRAFNSFGLDKVGIIPIRRAYFNSDEFKNLTDAEMVDKVRSMGTSVSVVRRSYQSFKDKGKAKVDG